MEETDVKWYRKSLEEHDCLGSAEYLDGKTFDVKETSEYGMLVFVTREYYDDRGRLAYVHYADWPFNNVVAWPVDNTQRLEAEDSADSKET